MALVVATPRFGPGTIVRHRDFGRGRVVAYDEERYVIIFPGGDVKMVPFAFEGRARRLRMLEQKINGHAALSPEEKLELQGYITRCYGSLTTFNVLFGNRTSSFVGQGESDE
jgi:hypothetical protein